MLPAVAAVKVATINVLYVIARSSVPQLFLVLSSWVMRVHLRLLHHVQTVEGWVLYALYLYQCYNMHTASAAAPKIR